MHKIFVSSTGDGSGQSLAAWGLMEIFRSRGIQTGFFKPFVTRPVVHRGTVVDKDALLIKSYYGLPEAVSVLCPITPGEVPSDEVTREEQLEMIDECLQAVTGGNDAMVIMGSDQIFYEADSPYTADTSLVTRLDASVLLIDKFQSESMAIYSVLAIESLLKDRLKLIIINKVPLDQVDTVHDNLNRVFTKRGLPPVLFLPEDRILEAFTIRHIVDSIGGDLLAAEERHENLVENISISSAHLKGSLNIFRRIYNKIILLGIGLDTLSTPLPALAVTGIILTGGRKPAPVVVNTCEDLRIPLIISPADTFITMDWIQKQRLDITSNDDYKLKRFLQLLGGKETIDTIVNQLTQP